MVEEPYLDLELINKRKEKNRADKRIFVLKPIEGKFSLTSAGFVDTGLFKGENNLNAHVNEFGNWYLKFDKGVLPPPLKQQWTNFNKVDRFVREYYLKRNIEVVKIID